MSSGSGSDDPGRRTRLAFFELGERDAETLRALQPLAERTVDGIVERFYEHLLAFPELKALLEEEPGRIDRLKGLQRAYFLSLTEGQWDEAYIQSRLRVGNAHQEIGLEPAWYIGAFGLYLRLALRTLVAETADGARILHAAEALVKLITFDMSLAIQTYIDGGFVSRELAEQSRKAARIAEEALAARADTERLKDELAAMVVHDLKNPVNGILMMAQLALRKGGGLLESHRAYLQQIDLTCREMLRLIENLLEISKIEEGKMPITTAPVVLAELVDEVAAEQQVIATHGGRTLEVAVSTDLPPVRADRALLRRVLANLIGNSLRHSGSSTVRVAAVVVDGGREVTLSVQDQGRGVPADTRRRIFEKFSSVPRSAADEPFRDTGLGLPFCKLAVEEMGGRIALEETPGGGATFTVTLAVAPSRSRG